MADLPKKKNTQYLPRSTVDPILQDYQVLENIVRRVHSTEKVNASLHCNLFSCG